MFRKSRLIPASLAAAALALGTASLAEQVCYERTVDLKPTNWTETRIVPQFDPTLGTLTGVTIQLDGQVQGTISYENQDAAPATIVSTLDGLLTVSSPPALLNLLLTESETANPGAYDGVLDFAGTSGGAFLDLGGAGSESITLTAPVDLAPFRGVGDVTFLAEVNVTYSVTGAGNLASLGSSEAGANIRVCYTYEVIPSPDCDGDGVSDADEIAAGAPDRNQNGIPDVCEPGDQGCTPGYWKNHPFAWAATGYSPGDDFDATFGVDAFQPNITLDDALNLGGGGIRALARHAVAALLNASHPDVWSANTPQEVIDAVAAAIASKAYEPTKNALAADNELGCPLSNGEVR